MKQTQSGVEEIARLFDVIHKIVPGRLVMRPRAEQMMESMLDSEFPSPES